ncbi:NAD-dependent epimerase/dehydratase family protein [Halococcus qingdaonensis]|uniref:NAD-dependent epimerase/dehydratase family protein n=1 Tax=Halococcus qingdaonensis TaxID=224402 RepID=UPI002115DA93|nr:NAD(P)-dependent oxidoreductase [Halococcus qingdaonensis]
MTRIAITGAAGNVGRTLLKGFDDHDVTPLVHGDENDIDGIVCDVTDREAFTEALAGQDVLVHLAGNASAYADWDDVREVNIDGVYNAYEAAIDNGLDRVVYASSNHAVNMDDVVDPSEPETMRPDAPPVFSDTDARPDSYYGITKVAGEAIGNYYAARHDIEVVHARIGWLMDREELVDTQENPDHEYPEAYARFARAMWLSHRDCRNFLERAATADLAESPVAAHGVSRNDERSLSLTETQRALGYRPRDNAGEALEN